MASNLEASTNGPPMAAPWPGGPGAMVRLIRAFEWGDTPLGPIETWSERLRSSVDLVLASGFPMAILHGSDLAQIYNDPFGALIRGKHPTALGQSVRECWPEAWEINRPIFDRVWAGETITFDDKPFPSARDGAPERGWFTVSYSPLRDEASAVSGVVITVIETTARHQAEAALRESDTRAHTLIEGITQAVWEAEPSGAVTTDSPSWRAITGQKTEEWLGFGWLNAVHPDDQPLTTKLWRQAVETRKPVSAEYRLRSVNGDWRWNNVRAAPVLDEDGTVQKWVGINLDVHDRKKAEEQLRDSEGRSAFLLELSDQLRSLTNAAEMEEVACRLVAERLGCNRAYYVELSEADGTARVGRHFRRAGLPSFTGEHPIAVVAWCLPLLRSGDPLVVTDVSTEAWIPEAGKSALVHAGLVAFVGAPLIKSGNLLGALSVTTDAPRRWNGAEVALVRETGERVWEAVERARAEARLRASEARFRTLAEGIPQLVWRSDVEGRRAWASPQWLAYTGQTEKESLGLGWLEAVHPEDRDDALKAWKELPRHGQLDTEYRVRRACDGTWRWHAVRSGPVRLTSGPGEAGTSATEWLGTTTDIEDLKQMQQRQEVLVAELQHRTRNLIGVVSALAERTINTASTLGDFSDRFERRLSTLSRVQGLLSHLSAGQRVTFDDLLRAELAALGAIEGDAGGDRVTLDGPVGIPLRSATVQTLALALHELATNASKYGALKSERGHLTVRWALTLSEARKFQLDIDWRESGVTMDAVEPARPAKGYGRELIERALPYQLGARTTFELGAEGVHCTIVMPIENSKRASPEVRSIQHLQAKPPSSGS